MEVVDWIVPKMTTESLSSNSEHQELLKQIQETQNQEVREDLERELDCLVKQMESKGEQLSKLRKHQENVSKPPWSQEKGLTV